MLRCVRVRYCDSMGVGIGSGNVSVGNVRYWVLSGGSKLHEVWVFWGSGCGCWRPAIN